MVCLVVLFTVLDISVLIRALIKTFFSLRALVSFIITHFIDVPKDWNKKPLILAVVKIS